jgi:peptidoglycan hydrolase-like protein with peptidoglycan-binding domain
MRRIISTTIVLLIAASGIALTPAARAGAIGSCTGTSLFRDQAGGIVSIPTIGTGNSNCLLGVGNAGMAVRVLQFALNDCYHAGLNPDGVFGPLTRAALQSAQRREGITADGVYGPQTRDHLHWPDDFALCERL